MLDSEILEKLQGASVKERIRVIEAILRSRWAKSFRPEQNEQTNLLNVYARWGSTQMKFDAPLYKNITVRF